MTSPQFFYPGNSTNAFNHPRPFPPNNQFINRQPWQRGLGRRRRAALRLRGVPYDDGSMLPNSVAVVPVANAQRQPIVNQPEPAAQFPLAFNATPIPEPEEQTSEVLELWLRGKAHALPPSHDEISILKSKDFKPALKPHGIRPDEAIRIIQESTKRTAALKEDDFKYSLPTKDPRNFPFALFNEIDAFLFGGVLRGNVHLKWSKKLGGCFGCTARPSKSGERIRIALSQELCSHGDPTLITEVLIHQMTHAFLLQCCEPKAESNLAHRHTLWHDPLFSATMYAVQKGLRSEPQEWPALMGCGPGNSMNPIGMKSGKDNYLSSSNCSDQDPGKQTINCSIVCERIQTQTDVPKMKVDKGCAKDASGRLYPLSHWLHEQPGSTPILRTEYEEKEPDFIELRYQDRAYPVPKKKCPEPGQSKLELAEDMADEKMFRLTFDYLTSGFWSPKPPPVSFGIDYSSSPKIAPTMPAETPYFLTQLRAYRAAMMLNLPNMREKALENLEKSGRAQCVEDPIVLLEMLYHGTTSLGAQDTSQESASGKKVKDAKKGGPPAPPPLRPAPDRDLRTWAKAFLKATTGDKKLPTNIDMLKRTEQYKHRFMQLRIKGNTLLEDADQCEAQLLEEGEKKAKKTEQEAEENEKETTAKAMIVALQNIGVKNGGPAQQMTSPGLVVPNGQPQMLSPVQQLAQILPAAGQPLLLMGGQRQENDHERIRRESEAFGNAINMILDDVARGKEEAEQRRKEAEEATRRLREIQQQLFLPINSGMPGAYFEG